MPLGEGNYVFFTVGIGQIWFTRRALDGTWVPAVQEQNPQLPGEAAAQGISQQSTFELQHVAIAAHGGELWHSRWDSQGQATVFVDVQATAAGRVGGGFMDVDAAHGPSTSPASRDLFVVGCTYDVIPPAAPVLKLWHTRRKSDGTWMPFRDMQAVAGQVQIGPVRNVSCATEEPLGGPGAAYHVVALTSDYRLFHTRFNIDTDTFSTFLDIESTGAGEAGNFTDVSCAWDGSSLHVCAVTSGTLKHTSMLPNGTWTPFADVKTLAASDPGIIEKVACAVPSLLPPVGTVSTGCLTAPVRLAQRIFRRRQPDPLDAIAPTPLVVVVLTTARQAWHTERDSSGWTPFEDIETTAAGAIGGAGDRPRYVAL